jgi:ADP-ribose pyrophosphatase
MGGIRKLAAVELVERRLVFRNSKFEVFSDHIRDPSGREVRDYLVVAPLEKAPAGVTGVAVLPIQEGAAVLLRMFRHPPRRPVLEVPRGFIDAGETPAVAAARELREETGLLCRPEEMIPLGYCFPEAGILAARVALFAAPDCKEADADEAGEPGLGETVRIPLSLIREQLARMEFEETTTCVCLHRYMLASESRLLLERDGGRE